MSAFSLRFESREGSWLAPALCVATVVAALMAAIAMFHGDGGHAAPPQSDSVVFYSYARAIADGHPYQFNAGDPPSTGSTSHIYPALLAPFHFVGARGDALVTVGLLLNTVCYLLTVLLVGLIARRLCPEAAPLAALLCALCGQTVFAAFGQTDMGLFMVLSLAALLAAVSGRTVWLAVALVACAWCRPEGLVLSVFVAASALWPSDNGTRKPGGALLAGLAGVVAFCVVLAFNWALTGHVGFHSVAGKGLLPLHSFAGAVFQIATSAADIARGVLFGLGADRARHLYLAPVLGGLLALAGLASRQWRRAESSRFELAWLIAGVAAIVLVAQSGFDGVQLDRYLAWFFPLWLIYASIGAVEVGRRGLSGRGFGVLATVLVAYQIIGVVHVASLYAQSCALTASNASFVASVNERLPKGSRLGGTNAVSYAYYLPDHHIDNIAGIVSPAFANGPFDVCNAELLKSAPEHRFDYWLLAAPEARGPWYSAFVGEQVLAETPVHGGDIALTLHRAQWETLDGVDTPLAPEALRAVAGMKLVDRIDVGDLRNEERCHYSLYTRARGAKIQPFLMTGQLAGRTISDVGRVVVGSETFRVTTRPRQPLRIVMRASARGTAPVAKPGRRESPQEFWFNPISRLPIFVNDEQALTVEARLSNDPDVFSEVVFDIPAEVIKGSYAVITIGGDHIAYGYWAYQ